MRKWSRRLFVPLTILVSIFFALLAVILYRIAMPMSPPRVDTIRELGYPVTLAELDSWYTRVSDEQNAALIHTNGFAALCLGYGEDGQPTIGNLRFPPSGHLVADEDKVELTSMLASNSVAMHEFASTLAMTNSRYPVQLTMGSLTPLPHLADVRSASYLFAADALLHMENGETDKALESLHIGFHVVNSLNNEPLGITYMTHTISVNTLIANLKRILCSPAFRGTASDGSLAALQSEIAEAAPSNAVARALDGEFVCGLDFYANGETRRALFSKRFGTNVPPIQQWKRRTEVAVAKITGAFTKDRDRYVEVMTTNLLNATLQDPDRFRRAQMATNLISGNAEYSKWSRRLLQSCSDFYIRDAVHRTRIRLAQTALAIERYRLAHSNSVPTELHALVPTYLKVIPMDPCDGQPVRFRVVEDGYVLYGVGIDGTDGGGLDARSDILFTVKR